ncbi:MAG: SDR family oxidoreductase [Acidimicrobiia bacterium]|nr:MAG: SDR family oxidoreductase [Acidimicrobiia bacterium]
MTRPPLDGRVAIVTGAARGLGRVISVGVAGAGATVVAADLDVEGARETVEMIAGRDASALALSVDVADEQSVQEMTEATLRHFGRVDILVNNAAIYGGLKRMPFMDISVEEWDRVLGVNLRGPWLCARAVFPAMRDQHHGRIVNIASAVFFSGSPNWAHYVSSKGGVIGLTRALAREVGIHGITVNAVAPGFTMTEASRALIEDAEHYGVERGAIKRAEKPGDVLGTVLFLASPDSEFLTGQTIVVDGGRQLH